MLKNIEGKVLLRSGVEMPGYGFGVYKAHGRELIHAVDYALGCGYRYIDTASFYENEEDLGQALKKCGLPRDQLFVLSKIWPTQFSNPRKALEESLHKLGLERLDGYLLHWPGLNESLRLKTFEYLLEAREKGLIAVAGVSNFLVPHLDELHRHFGIWPDINQIEVHPLFQQKELRKYCREKEIHVVSWSPLGRGHSLALPRIDSIARQVERSPAQVILRWQIQQDLTPIPKSVHEARIRENAQVFDFELDARQMESIDALDLPDHQGRTGKDPMEWPAN